MCPLPMEHKAFSFESALEKWEAPSLVSLFEEVLHFDENIRLSAVLSDKDSVQSSVASPASPQGWHVDWQ